MEFQDVVRARRMVRTYDPDRPVPEAVLTGLLELAIRAPSAGFSQGWDFLVLRTPAATGRFWQATRRRSDQRDESAGERGDESSSGQGDESSDRRPGDQGDERSGGQGDERLGARPDRWLAGMRTAPVLMLCLSDRDRYLDRYAEPDKGWDDRDPARWPVPYWDVDTGMAGLLMLLGAVDAGLGGCFFGVPPESRAAVLAEFGVPPGRHVVGVISLGYPAPADRRSPSLRRGRRPLTEVAHDANFGTPWGAATPPA